MSGSRVAPTTGAHRTHRDVRVRLDGGRGYVVRMAEGGFDGLSDFLGPLLRRASRVLLLTDARVWRHHGHEVAAALEEGASDLLTLRVPAGERSKSFSQYERILDRLIRERVDRSALLVALGGGVVGDLGGFVAATYLRGIAFVQLPTTVLAQVDSSVGGKTGINHARGKNLVGAFHQPRAVYAAMKTLETLSERDYRSGLAEVVKYGVIRDRALFRRLERESTGIRARDPRLLSWIVARSVAAKARIVERDERESGERALLNLGHTLGHAIEQSEDYGQWSHGEAVSVGTVAASRVAVGHGWMTKADADRVEHLLAELGLPTQAPGLRLRAVRSAMRRDKKVRSGEIRFVAPAGVGSAELRWLPVDQLARELVEAATA